MRRFVMQLAAQCVLDLISLVLIAAVTQWVLGFFMSGSLALLASALTAGMVTGRYVRIVAR